MTPIKGSSNVVGALYEPARGILSVKFKGGAIYEYTNVTAAQHKALMKADSAGTWVQENLVRKPIAHPATKQTKKP